MNFLCTLREAVTVLTSLSSGIGSGIESISLSFHTGFRLLFTTFVFIVCTGEKKEPRVMKQKGFA
jgi:hypothetical protein